MGGGRLFGVLGAALASLVLTGPALAADPAPELAQPAAPAAKSWAAPQIASVVLAGVMGPDVDIVPARTTR